MIKAEIDKNWRRAVEIYAELVRTHSNAGYHNLASKFHYRQEVCNRKLYGEELRAHWNQIIAQMPSLQFGSLAQLFKRSMRWTSYRFFELSVGYFEKPERVLYTAVVIIIGSSFFYYDYHGFDYGVVAMERFIDQSLRALYFSAVSFTALGYGDWVDQPTGWNRHLGVLESIVGVAFLAILVLTVSRRFIR